MRMKINFKIFEKQYILISKLDNNMNSLNENLKKNSNKIEEILKRTSSYSLIIAMIIQILVILFLIFI